MFGLAINLKLQLTFVKIMVSSAEFKYSKASSTSCYKLDNINMQHQLSQLLIYLSTQFSRFKSP